MRNIAKALSFLVGFLPSLAVAQVANYPQTLPANTIVGRLGISSGPSQAIPFSVLLSNLPGAQASNRVFAGPSSGSSALPAFRALVGADLPAPGASSLGGIQSLTCSSHNWFNTLSTAGVLGCSQPAFTDISGTIAATQLPNPTASTLGGVQSKVVVSHQFLNTISTSGVPGSAQPACTDLSDATSCNAARGQLPGETSNGSATSGNVGEYIESVIPTGSAVALTTNVNKTITSISLTAGDWDVSGNLGYTTAASTSVTILATSISLTTNTADATNGRENALSMAAIVPGAGTFWYQTIGPLRFSLSATTTVYLVGFGTFTASTLNSFGIIRARRVR